MSSVEMKRITWMKKIKEMKKKCNDENKRFEKIKRDAMKRMKNDDKNKKRRLEQTVSIEENRKILDTRQLEVIREKHE